MEGINFPEDITVVIAHPDDEFLMAIWLWHNYKKFGKNAIFCATRGEKGIGYMDRPITQEEMARIRTEEFYWGNCFLGISESDRFLGNFPDGGLTSSNPLKVELKKRLREFILKTAPKVVVTFGAGGYSGHGDHQAVSDVTLDVCEELGIIVYVVTPPLNHICPDFQKFMLEKRRKGFYTDGTDPVPDIHIYGSPEIKTEMLHIYKSQRKGIDYREFISDREQADRLLKREFYKKLKFPKK